MSKKISVKKTKDGVVLIDFPDCHIEIKNIRSWTKWYTAIVKLRQQLLSTKSLFEETPITVDINEKQYRSMLKECERLVALQPERHSQDAKYLDAIAILIEAYEKKYYAFGKG